MNTEYWEKILSEQGLGNLDEKEISKLLNGKENLEFTYKLEKI